MRIVIVGLGGIGTFVTDYLSRFLNYSEGNEDVTVHLIDGDIYEEKNKARQTFENIEGVASKSNVKRIELQTKFPNVKFKSHFIYLDQDNIHEFIQDKDIVFICVDNHKTRYLINEHAKNLNNIIIINGGNELYDGNVQLFIKKGGKNETPDLTQYHPEIENFSDKLPHELSCEERQVSSPQLLFTNMYIASTMLCVFYQCLNNLDFKNYSEWYFDLRSPLILDAKQRVAR